MREVASVSQTGVKSLTRPGKRRLVGKVENSCQNILAASWRGGWGCWVLCLLWSVWTWGPCTDTHGQHTPGRGLL